MAAIRGEHLKTSKVCNASFGCFPANLDPEKKMKFAKILGLPLSVIGLILYCTPLQRVLTHLLGGAARTGAAILFASGWALLLGHILYHLGMKTEESRSGEISK